MKLAPNREIKEGITYQQIEEGTEIYIEGEAYILDESPYSTYLFVFSDVQFIVYAVSIEKAIGVVKGLPEYKNYDWKNNRYAVTHLTNTEGWHGSSIDRSNRNSVVNHLAKSLFNENT